MSSGMNFNQSLPFDTSSLDSQKHKSRLKDRIQFSLCKNKHRAKSSPIFPILQTSLKLSEDNLDKSKQTSSGQRQKIKIQPIKDVNGKNKEIETPLVSSIREEQREEEEKQGVQSVQSLIDALFEKSRLSDLEMNFINEYHQFSQEEGKILLKSFKEELSQQFKISEKNMRGKMTEKLVQFQYFEPDLDDYIIEKILGRGLHGVVIKMINKVNGKTQVIKLYRKEDEEAFLREAVLTSNMRKVQRSSSLENKYFQTAKYYGLFLEEGIGSFADFRSYLQEQKQKKGVLLSKNDFFVLAYCLLRNSLPLHKMNHCHRDIKPANIILHPNLLNPELIDFSLASEFSKAVGNPGTPGYRMTDFEGMRDLVEKDKHDQLLSNDYFALGKTLLEIAFPDAEIITLTDIKERLGNLGKICNSRVIKRTIKNLLFGNLESKKKSVNNFLICSQFRPGDLIFRCMEFPKRHKEKLKNYMEMRRTDDKNELQKIASRIPKKSPAQTLQSENTKEDDFPRRFLKYVKAKKEFSKLDRNKSDDFLTELFSELERRDDKTSKDPEEKYISEYIKNNQDIRHKCSQIIHAHLRQIEISHSQQYSRRMVKSYQGGFLDHAINLGEKALSLKKVDWIFLNNFTFLHQKRKTKQHLLPFANEYRKYLPAFKKNYFNCFTQDLVQICGFKPFLSLKAGEACIKRLNMFGQEELILTFLKIELIYKKSYFFINYSWILCLHILERIDQPTKDRINNLVTSVNYFERDIIFNLLKFSDEERAFFALIQLCEIFKELPCDDDEIELNKLRKEAEAILSERNRFEDHLKCPGNEAWKPLFEYELTYAMLGFFIFYNLQIDLQESEFGEFNIFELINRRDDNYWKPKYHPKIDRQSILDTIVSFLKGGLKEEFEFDLPFWKRAPDSRISSLSIYGRQLHDLYFCDFERASAKINFKKNFIFCSALDLNCVLGRNYRQDEDFSDPELQHLERLYIRFSTINSEQTSIEGIKVCETFSVATLKDLRIVVDGSFHGDDEALFTDENLIFLSKFISNQPELNRLSLQFIFGLVTWKSINSLAAVIKSLTKLQELQLSFRHCPKIESNSFSSFLYQISNLKELKSLNLYFGACSGVTSLKVPTDLNFKVNVVVNIVER